MRPRPQWGHPLEEHYCVLLILMVLLIQSEAKGGLLLALEVRSNVDPLPKK